jgi:putative ABC transport system permease protein
VIVIPDNDVVRYARLNVGDKLVYRFGEGADAQTITFEIVGITQQSLVSGLGSSGIYAPRDAFPETVPANAVSVLVDVDEAQVNALRREMSSIPGAFMLETAAITRLLEGLLATFIAFPTMVALLGIVVGGVVIANSVALSTMERRREIAVMKAVGLQRERVMGMILLENAIMGLIGGLIGVGIGLLALVLMLSVSQGPGNIIPIGTALLLMGMCIAVALIAAATTAWGASGEKPLNVLRYE